MIDNVLSIKGERKADHDAAGKDYFVREVAYGAFQRDFARGESPLATRHNAEDDRSEGCRIEHARTECVGAGRQKAWPGPRDNFRRESAST